MNTSFFDVHIYYNSLEYKGASSLQLYMKQTTTVLSILALTLLPALLSAAVPSKPTEVNPIEVGSTVPDITLTKADGSSVELRELVAKKATVMVFYRGGWCPYCTKHLAALADVESALLDKGYQIISLSPDKVATAQQSASDYNYSLYSDSMMEASTAFGLTYKLDEATLKKLKGYKIDIEAASGQTHHQLPVPAVYIIGTDGIIQFRYYNVDYSKRLSAEDILKVIN